MARPTEGPRSEIPRVAGAGPSTARHRRILFVCTDNICRSPMAEYLARALAADPNLEYRSAGTHARTGDPPSWGTVVAMQEMGIDVSGHRAAAVWDVADRADVLVALAESHAEAMRSRWPHRSGDIVLLHPDGRSVADPYGRSIAEYRRAREEIAAALACRWPF